MKKIFFLLCAVVLTVSANAENNFHATWISTVGNIDWPSREAVGNTQLQKQEMCQMLDTLYRVGINAIVFQVRPTADALYPSKLEPWSSWLTGKQGQNNDVDYDPLQFVLDEAHRRGMQVHVWINPYRITNGFELSDLAPTHIYFRHPEWFWKYGKQWYFEPGLDETRQWLCNVVADIVSRYDVQGIHMDDYFYPYKVQGEDYPDRACFAAHPRGFDKIEDWRRNNVNMAIREVHETIQRINPSVEFGISPFGVWRNKSQDPMGSDTREMTNYDDLYADILLWLREGWIDYVCPQLYWYIGQPGSDYSILVRWWAEHLYGKKLYTGMAAYKMRDPRFTRLNPNAKGKDAQRSLPDTPWSDPNEICRQLRLNRTIPEVQGEVYFSTKALLRNPLYLCDSLRTVFYTR